MILYIDGVEIVQAGQYYNAGHTENEAESFVIWDTLVYLSKLIWELRDLRCTIQVFGDS